MNVVHCRICGVVRQDSLRFGIGGLPMTCLSSLWKFRYPGGFLGLGFLSSATFSFGSAMLVTLPPSRSEHSRSNAFPPPTLAPVGSVHNRLPSARYSGKTLRQDNGTNGTAQR